MTTNGSIPVSLATHLLTKLATNHTALWKKLGNLETRLLRPELTDLEINAPIYISGLARSGSTLLLETLASHTEMASHTYGDFPFLFTPCWWNAATKLSRKKQSPLQRRAHGDGIYINQHSPEAMEEIIWMAFFEQLHTTDSSNVLNQQTEHPEFEIFYLNHIKKILHIRKAARYLAKANYNVTRLEYLHRLFPDARFIIPVRHPAAQIESLMRQHTRFTVAAKHNSRVISQMKAGGHFEFGSHRIPIHTGDNKQMAHLIHAWKNGNEAEGYAHQWNMVYGYLHSLLKKNPALAEVCVVIPFEKFCANPHEMLNELFNHCGLTVDDKFLAQKASNIRLPEHNSGLDKKEIASIQKICNETAHLYGY